MFNKKIFFSLCTIPVAIFCNDNSDWQKRRKEEKNGEIKRRTQRLTSDSIDITPKDGKFIFNGMTPEQIEKEFGFKRVKVRGLMDLEKEVRVETNYKGEKGYQIICPLYTHVNEDKEPCGILVDRGFISSDFEETRTHMAVDRDGYFEGILYCGDKETKYDDQPNTPAADHWFKVYPNQIALDLNLKNREDSGVAMLKLVEFDEDLQTSMPNAPTIKDLTSWKNMPERHHAYEVFWKYTTYFNLFANTMFWLYF